MSTASPAPTQNVVAPRGGQQNQASGMYILSQSETNLQTDTTTSVQPQSNAISVNVNAPPGQPCPGGMAAMNRMFGSEPTRRRRRSSNYSGSDHRRSNDQNGSNHRRSNRSGLRQRSQSDASMIFQRVNAPNGRSAVQTRYFSGSGGMPNHTVPGQRPAPMVTITISYTPNSLVTSGNVWRSTRWTMCGQFLERAEDALTHNVHARRGMRLICGAILADLNTVGQQQRGGGRGSN